MKTLHIALTAGLLLASPALQAQNAPRRGGWGRGRGFLRLSPEEREQLRNMSPEDRRAWFQKRMEEARKKRRAEFLAKLKDQLKPKDDEEWQILEMQIKQILDLRGSRYRRYQSSDELKKLREQSREAWQALQELLKQDEPPADQLKAAMAKLRGIHAQRKAAEEKARREAEAKRKQDEAKLKQLRDELRSIVTLRQEAVLLANGVLD